MKDFIPDFDWARVMVEPWTINLPITLWIVVMGFLITSACGLISNYLILRRMALVGDAISHSILPGLAMAFLFSQSETFQIPAAGKALEALELFTFQIEMGARDALAHCLDPCATVTPQSPHAVP